MISRMTFPLARPVSWNSCASLHHNNIECEVQQTTAGCQQTGNAASMLVSLPPAGFIMCCLSQPISLHHMVVIVMWLSYLFDALLGNA